MPGKTATLEVSEHNGVEQRFVAIKVVNQITQDCVKMLGQEAIAALRVLVVGIHPIVKLTPAGDGWLPCLHAVVSNFCGQ